MIYKKDSSMGQCGEFDAQIQTLDIPGEIKLGYSPIGFVRCGRSACRATAFKFKVGRETGGKKMESPHSLKSNEMAQVSFRPQQPLVVDSQKLRGPLPHRLPRRQHRRHAWQGRVRHPEEGHAAGGGQEEEVVARVCARVPPSYLLSEVMTVCAA